MTFAQQVVILILGGGGAASIYTLVRALLAYRNNAEAREDKAIENLERWRIDSDDRATKALADADYWRAQAAKWEHLARSNGLTL